MPKCITRAALIFTPALLLAAALQPAHAQRAYPAKPIRLVIPFAAGPSGTNILARLVFPKVTDVLGQPVVIENRPGGNGSIGAEIIARAPADGYNIMMTVNNHLTNNLLIPNLGFDVIKDFAAVSTIGLTPYVLVIHPSIPADNLQAFIALVKAKPGGFNNGVSGAAGPSHMAGVYLNMMAGISMQQVSYKGAAPALADVLGGHLQSMFSPPVAVIAHVNGKKLKGLAITGQKRSPHLPEVPTFAEAGFPKFEASAWYGVMAPAGMPRPVIDTLSQTINGVLGAADVREQFSKQGVEPFISTPDQFAAQMRAEHATVTQIIKAANITLQE